MTGLDLGCGFLALGQPQGWEETSVLVFVIGFNVGFANTDEPIGVLRTYSIEACAPQNFGIIHVGDDAGYVDVSLWRPRLRVRATMRFPLSNNYVSRVRNGYGISRLNNLLWQWDRTSPAGPSNAIRPIFYNVSKYYFGLRGCNGSCKSANIYKQKFNMNLSSLH